MALIFQKAPSPSELRFYLRSCRRRDLTVSLITLLFLQATGARVAQAMPSVSKPTYWIDQVPLKRGVWEMSVQQGMHVIIAPIRKDLCSSAPSWYFFPSVPTVNNFGHRLPDKIINGDTVMQLSSTQFRVHGGEGTIRGGPVVWDHIITLHGDDKYDDTFTVTTHADKHPQIQHYTGSGHWIAPCPDASRPSR